MNALQQVATQLETAGFEVFRDGLIDHVEGDIIFGRPQPTISAFVDWKTPAEYAAKMTAIAAIFNRLGLAAIRDAYATADDDTETCMVWFAMRDIAGGGK